MASAAPKMSTVEEADHKGDVTQSSEVSPTYGTITGVDDEAIIPKGALDPVYEAKARVLNHAVRICSL
jgi:hypothetical protein